MENHTTTREDILQRFRSAKQKKKESLAALEVAMRAQFKELTGKDAVTFNVW